MNNIPIRENRLPYAAEGGCYGINHGGNRKGVAVRFDDATFMKIRRLAEKNQISFAAQVRRLVAKSFE